MRTILVVDDEPRIADIIETFLQKNGYAVIKAPGGAEAIEIIASGAPLDLMLVDMKMPGVSGIDVIRKRDELGRAIPALILSGSLDAMKHFDHNGTTVCPEDILNKPIDLFMLLDRIQKKIGER